MSAEERANGLCAYVCLGGFGDKAEKLVCVREGTRFADEAKANIFTLSLLVEGSSFERRHLI